MNTLKEISIKQYLAGMNIHPAKDYNYYGMYNCPYREDRNASFKVDYQKNLWHDFGTSEGGSIIDLVMKMGNYTFHQAANMLENNPAYMHISNNADKSFSFHGNKFSNIFENKIENIIPITHPKLIAWVQERKIDLDLANLYCREIHYQNQSGQFFSIGFGNDKDGYELSSPTGFKGCFPPKDIKTIRNDGDVCLVFEGFWDFLSYLAIQKVEQTKHDVAVLNSEEKKEKAMNFLKRHNSIYTYLDNDDAGRKATELIKSANSTAYNRPTQYAEYKDLNDYLCGEKQFVKPAIEKKKTGVKIH
jgi:DNA primase